jgi:RNA polymerase sigma factor (TIGR02999 family)
LSAVLPQVYDELRRVAASYMRRERDLQTVDATGLVHEAYVRLERDGKAPWTNRAHFCAIAANAMRQILVERARARHAAKRGGTLVRVTLVDEMATPTSSEVDLDALHEALDRLARLDAGHARLVELRYFGGLTIEETAEALGRSPATVKRDWAMARAWLHRELSARGPEDAT